MKITTNWTGVVSIGVLAILACVLAFFDETDMVKVVVGAIVGSYIPTPHALLTEAAK